MTLSSFKQLLMAALVMAPLSALHAADGLDPYYEASYGAIAQPVSLRSLPDVDLADPVGCDVACGVACGESAGCSDLKLGDWFRGDAITVEAIYTGNVFNNMRGGITTKNATAYQGLLDVALTADLDALGFFPGGTFFMLAEEIHGKGITEDYVGDFQCLSNIDAAPRTQISEYWWEKAFLQDFITMRIGKQDSNADFAVVDLAGDFINSSFGFQPTIPMVSYPDPSMAVAAFFQMTENSVLKAGVWDGSPDGRNWGFSNTGTTLSLIELDVQWALACGRLPGRMNVGMWYHNDQFSDLRPAGLGMLGMGGSGWIDRRAFARRDNGSPGGFDPSPAGAGDTYTGNHGVYFGAEQIVLRESSDPEDEQGLGVFFQWGWAPKDRNDANQYYGAGVVYKGLLCGRDDDTCGVAANQVAFSPYSSATSCESVFELFYKAQLTDRLIVQPDLQYIANPSGAFDDAFVAGLRFEFAL